MTEEQAIKVIEDIWVRLEQDYSQYDIDDVLEIAVEAIGKQIPKEKYDTIFKHDVLCPSCMSKLYEYKKFRYCPECGQRLREV